MRRAFFLALLTWALVPWAQGSGFAALRPPAEDLSLGEAGGAARLGPERAVVNPAALSVTSTSLWLEAGDQSGVRQQRVGLGLQLGAVAGALDLGLDSIDGLEARDDQGASLGDLRVQAPWAQVTVAGGTNWGRWGLGAGARDRRWQGSGFDPELAGGWAWNGPLSLGVTVAWRERAPEGQASVEWRSSSGRWGLQGGQLFQGQESRMGLGAQWELWPGLALRLGWTRWLQYENQRLGLGLGWQSSAQTMSYAWLPGAAIGSAQKLSVAGHYGPSAPPTPTPTISPSPIAILLEPNFTPSPSPAPTPKQVELDFVLPK